MAGRPRWPPAADRLMIAEKADDFFAFIDALHELPNEYLHNAENAHDDERPAKRAKTSSADDSFIPLYRRSLAVTLTAPNRQCMKMQRLRDAMRVLSFRYQDGVGLLVATRNKRLIGRSVKFMLKPAELGELSDWAEEEKTLLRIAGETGPQPPASGLFWTHADLRVDQKEDQATLTLDFELRWNTSRFADGSLLSPRYKQTRQGVLDLFCPDVERDRSLTHRHSSSKMQSHDGHGHVSLNDFYEAAHVPAKDDSDAADTMTVFGLTASLFPFQRRAVMWLLNREGVQYDEGRVTPYHAPPDPQIASHFTHAVDVDGRPFFVSTLFGLATRDTASVIEANETACRGGILSEEMGLGKTVEMISLILLHRRPLVLPAAEDDWPRQRQTGATLIVTPPALKDQWVSEFRKHAPDLAVMVYEGMAKACPDKASEAAMVEKLTVYDVVITTYSALQSELHFAVEPPQRNLRGVRSRPRRRSPLVQLEWWRVCLDEAQEIESGVTNAATVVRVVPRVNAWGVTGTPVKNSIDDLRGLLVFLRLEPYATVTRVWESLVYFHREEFQSLFGRILMRHTKRVVGDELSIPPQKRYIIKMPFTAVEEQHYQSLFKQLVERCGLDVYGTPLRPDWDPEGGAIVEAMRFALNRLRQTALHPEIGEVNRRALGRRAGAGPLRTLEEVLDAMVEQSENGLLSDRRALLSHKLKHGQLLENSPRVAEALEIWQDVLQESKALVNAARTKLESEMERAKETEGGNANKTPEDSESGKDEDDDQDKAADGRVGEAQRELRFALEILHRSEFFCANAYFQIKSNEEMTPPDSDRFKSLEKLEVESYERAKDIRREILHDTGSKARRQMAELSGKAAGQDFAVIPECVFINPGGIEGRRIADNMGELGSLLNRQADQLDTWREAVIQLLLKGLVDEDEGEEEGNGEIIGDEYEKSTKAQEEIQAYLTILKAGISDRQLVLTGEAPSGLAKYEEQLALRLARNDEGPAPQLMLELFEERRNVMRHLPALQLQSLRAVMGELREVSVRLRSQVNNANGAGNVNFRSQAELALTTAQLKNTQQQQAAQMEACTALDKEMDKVRRALNMRIAYYRQLQAMSDLVAPYEGVRDEEAVEVAREQTEVMAEALATAEAKHRYLVHLQETDSGDEQRLCIICQTPFTVGVLTVCGHRFCKECMMAWFQAHQNCPVCKRALREANLHDIVLRRQAVRVVSEVAEDSGSGSGSGSGGSSGSGSKSSGKGNDNSGGGTKTIYANFSTDQLAMDLPGPSFSTKVDMLVRHLLWLRVADARTKTIVFSQFPDFLAILAEALTRHHIGFSRYEDRNGIATFKEDPAVECFLLQARAHASGLNLVNASHVILCEPLVNTALELQAIARVHRIGQQAETTVWLYLVDGTVEEYIYNLSVQRRMEHMDRTLDSSLDSSLELANSLELQQAQLSRLMGKGKMGGEAVDEGDLWRCLFGNGAKERRRLVADE